jgi:ABC-type bacteriocin/lantibiotic exporter with double-glycine peptidase domain
VIVIAVMSQIYITKLNARHQENQKLRNKTALETIENVYTITSLGIKTVVIKNYTKKLQSSYWESVGNIVLQGILLSSVQSALYALSAALMYIGAVIYTSSQEYAGINGIIRFVYSYTVDSLTVDTS